MWKIIKIVIIQKANSKNPTIIYKIMNNNNKK